MLYRKIIKDLQFWKDNKTTALLIQGARQVGKSSIIREFIEGFDNFIEIDFTKNTTALNLLLEIKSYDELVNRLSIISPVNIQSKGNNILFLDEIQYYYEIRQKRIEEDSSFSDYIDIITLSKEISERGDFRLILSGSMLGVSIFNTNHNPTGYLEQMTMYPMDFEEFLLANGISKQVIEEIRTAFIDKKPISEALHDILLKKYNEYLFVGGFPKAVQGYVDDKTLTLTTDALDTIDNWYKSDIIKYASKEDRLIILEMYNILPSEISKKNKKFVKSHMDVLNFKNLELEDRYLWLKNAGISIPTYNVTNSVYPLNASKDHKIVKLFMNDVGLLTHKLFNKEGKRKLIIDSNGIDLGAVTENMVAELLFAHNYNPFFQSTKKRGEIDFIIERNMEIIPIEIKSCEPDKKTGLYEHSALNKLLDSHPEIKESWVFGLNNVSKENDRIQMFPIYMIDFVTNE